MCRPVLGARLATKVPPLHREKSVCPQPFLASRPSAASHHGAPGHLHKEAVGSGENPLGIDQRAPTNVGMGELQANLPRPLAFWGQRPSHDPPGHGPQSTVWREAEEMKSAFLRAATVLLGPEKLRHESTTHPRRPLCPLNLIRHSYFPPTQSSHMVG